ncbi:TrkH family potassium uptake protein [Aerophototrophica crusticola]|uniref:Trk system potassium uptake protein n=1 Tax=Aerophototrophica crusticola TaxID=1709002 RepID=A0A858R9A3_9PROT|nr:TrkH family potassium uptake protein [Rhodospirillaceae bacterium B3]
MSALDVRPIFYVIGSLLVVLATAMLVPMLVDLSTGHRDWQTFAVSAALTLFFGVLLMLTNRTRGISLNLRQTFVLTTLAWIVVCLFSSLPFMLSESKLGFADGFFEAMSGLTTTGASVYATVSDLPPGILLWRALLVWLGGIGIVGMGIVILPFLRVGGMQLFRAESSDKSDKVVPRAADLALGFGWVYLALTIACVLGMTTAGMGVFDAICHAMAALGTGGFSTQDTSIGAYKSPGVEWVTILFMYLGSLPFVRFISMVRGDTTALWRDSQVRNYTVFCLVVSAVLALYLLGSGQMGIGEAFRHSLFNCVSLITTTGFASTDYTLWGPGPVALFFILTFVGGCTGSTSGGIKMFRFEILWLALRTQVHKLFSPRRVLPLAYNGKPVDAEVIVSVMGFTFVYMALILIIAVGLGLTGLDFVTAISGAASALGNVGPGLGSLIGPVGNYSTLEDEAKWLLSLGMLLGRLELFTVLVMLSPNFWRT